MHEFDYALMSGTVLKCIDFEWQGLFVCVYPQTSNVLSVYVLLSIWSSVCSH